MRIKTTLLALICSIAASALFAAAPEQVTVQLNPQDKIGLEHVTARYNVEQQAKHDADQAAKPIAERVAYVPVTEAQYLQMRVADMLKSYTEAYSEYRMNLPENVEFFKKATLLTEAQKAQLKALIDQQAGQ